jgi:hypothetical protein
MEYRHDGEWRQLARVTGPRHNWLGLLLTTRKLKAQPQVEAVGAESDAEGINADDVLAQVSRGIEQANTELGTAFSVKGVRFVRSDTPSDGIYEYLAQSIAREAARETEPRDQRWAAG